MLPTIRRPVHRIFESPLDLLERGLNPFRELFWDQENGDATAVYPVDIREDDNAVLVEAEMPGFKKEEIQVSLTDGILNIAAERKSQTESKSEPKLHERRFTKVERRFTLPIALDDANVEAKLEDGVLKLRLPKRPEAKPSRIAIR